MGFSEEIVEWLYWYGCDFMINAANLLGLSYTEANGLLFGLVGPIWITAMLLIGTLRSMFGRPRESRGAHPAARPRWRRPPARSAK